MGSRPLIHPSFVQSFLTLLENHMQRIVEMPIDTIVMVSNDIDRSAWLIDFQNDSVMP